MDATTLATVTVSFNPDVAALERQLGALPAGCAKIVVDNASEPRSVVAIQGVIAHSSNARLLRNDRNMGLASAVNRGVTAVANLQPQPRFVLLLDQDSEPHAGSIERLIRAFDALEAGGEKVGCVGPLLRDPDTGLNHGFHQCTWWRWKRVYPRANSITPVPCANLNGSGTLVRTELFLQLGGLDESLFIDHVDTDWAFRVLAAGYMLSGVPDAVFDHRMGQASIRFWWFGWRVWPSRSPQRHYYLFRNATILMGRPYVPSVWKAWACAKLLAVLALHLFFDHARLQQAANIFRGVRDGLCVRRGKVC